jgi:hypothetical protein
MIALFGFLCVLVMIYFGLVVIPRILGSLIGLVIFARRYPKALWVIVPLIGLFVDHLADGYRQSATEIEHPIRLQTEIEDHAGDGRLGPKSAEALQKLKDHELYEQLFGKEGTK